jgi:glucose/arabinose dehydrogenase
MFNLASVCLANRKVDDAIAILQKLEGSGDPEVAMRARQELDQAMSFKQHAGALQLQVAEQDGAAAEDRQPAAEEHPPAAEGQSVETPPATPLPARFLKGKIVAADCSASPQAVLTVASGAKSVKVHVRDSSHVVLIGADQFSCDWKNKSVAVNYRERPDGDGDVISLELQ